MKTWRWYLKICRTDANMCVCVDRPSVQSRFSCLEGVNVATAVFVIVTEHLLVGNHKVMLKSVELTNSISHPHSCSTLSLSFSLSLSLSVCHQPIALCNLPRALRLSSRLSISVEEKPALDEMTLKWCQTLSHQGWKPGTCLCQVPWPYVALRPPSSTALCQRELQTPGGIFGRVCRFNMVQWFNGSSRIVQIELNKSRLDHDQTGRCRFNLSSEHVWCKSWITNASDVNPQSQACLTSNMPLDYQTGWGHWVTEQPSR